MTGTDVAEAPEPAKVPGAAGAPAASRRGAAPPAPAAGDAGRSYAFLLCHGSFNPVHRHHVEIMVQARGLLETKGYKVVAGILAPTHRRHIVTWKGVAALADKHRLAALRLACEEAGEPSGWLRFDPRGVDYGAGHKMITKLLEPEFQEEFPGAVGFTVQGADVVAKHECYKTQLWHPSVIVARDGATAAVAQGFAQQGLDQGCCALPDEGVQTFFLPDELPGAFCSTALRAALRRGDLDAVHELCPRGAAEYLMANRRSLYYETTPFTEAGRGGDNGALKRQRTRPAPPAERSAGEVQVYFVRHGEARHNVLEDAWKERDPPLTAAGEAQAERLQDQSLLAPLKRPLLVVVSPLRRALQTATLCWGEEDRGADGVRFVANSDLQETAPYPCDTGRPQAELAREFPAVDFTGIQGEAWIEKEGPDHDCTWWRLERFTQWCAARPEDELVAVTHQNVCRELIGAVLANCDVVGASLDREQLRWSPLAYAGARPETLRMTATRGTGSGVPYVVANPGGYFGEVARADAGCGWPMLHHAAMAGSKEAVQLLLWHGADAEQVASCGYTAREWAVHHGYDEVVAVFDEFAAAWPCSLRSTWHDGGS